MNNRLLEDRTTTFWVLLSNSSSKLHNFSFSLLLLLSFLREKARDLSKREKRRGKGWVDPTSVKAWGLRLPWDPTSVKAWGLRLPWDPTSVKARGLRLPWDPTSVKARGLRLPWDPTSVKARGLRLPWDPTGVKAWGLRLPWWPDGRVLPWELGTQGSILTLPGPVLLVASKLELWWLPSTKDPDIL